MGVRWSAGMRRCVDDVEIVVVAYGAPELSGTRSRPVRGLRGHVVDNSSMPEIARIAREAGAAILGHRVEPRLRRRG